MSRDSSYAVDAVDGGVLKPLLALSGPIALANLLQVGYTLADTFWVGRLGGPAVSALGFSWAIVFAVLSLAGGFNVAGSVLVDPFFVLGFRDNVLLGALGLSAVERSLYAVTGFGGLGVEGAAVATVVSRGLGAAVAVGLLLSGRVGVNPSPSAFVPRRAVVVRLVRLGVPASVEQATNAVGVAVAHGAAYLRIVGATFAFVGVFRVLKGAFRGGGATTAAMVASVASLVLLRVPAAYALVHWFGAAAGGVWYGIAFSNVAICLLAAAWFRRGTWADRLASR